MRRSSGCSRSWPRPNRTGSTHKRQSGGALRALIEECLPKTVGQPSNNNTILSSAPIGIPQLQREALIEDIFQMLADNSGRFIRAMNPLS